MQDTSLNKLRFLAQYLGQNAFLPIGGSGNEIDNLSEISTTVSKLYKLKLKPMSSI